MFKKRPFRRRGFRRPMAARKQVALRRLQKAHRSMAEGSFPEARRIFEELGNAAKNRGIPRAPQLLLQAGAAALKAGDQEGAMGLFSRGLRLMENMGQINRLPAASQRVLVELESSGLQEEHDAMQKQIVELLARHHLQISSIADQKKRLPGKCPQCGGIVHPQEVEWIDDASASCDYCGSMLEVV